MNKRFKVVIRDTPEGPRVRFCERFLWFFYQRLPLMDRFCGRELRNLDLTVRGWKETYGGDISFVNKSKTYRLPFAL